MEIIRNQVIMTNSPDWRASLVVIQHLLEDGALEDQPGIWTRDGGAPSAGSPASLAASPEGRLMLNIALNLSQINQQQRVSIKTDL